MFLDSGFRRNDGWYPVACCGVVHSAGGGRGFDLPASQRLVEGRQVPAPWGGIVHFLSIRIEKDIMIESSMSLECYKRLKVQRESNRFLLAGLTGGIATGKTAVAEILGVLGSEIIDFDILARQVVEPGKPAWEKIVDYFGKNVLQEDRCLDRKKISAIVFGNPGKRKVLESITHPLIFEEFENRLNDISQNCPGAIVHGVMPLMIEIGLQGLFQKVIVVYISRASQIRRLVVRDKISLEDAENILKAQVPIEEKLRYADFVINNEGTLDETRIQVERLWQALKRIQKDRNPSLI